MNNNELIELAYNFDNQGALNRLFGKPYNISELKKLIYNTDYTILGIGVIPNSFLAIPDGKEKIESLVENHISIQNEDEYENFLKKLKNEKEKKDSDKKLVETIWKEKLKFTIEDLSSDTLTEEKKNQIFQIVVNSPTNSKKDIEDDYWKVLDIVGTAEKAMRIFNCKPGIKIGKNDFPQKNREKKKEEN